MRLIDADALKNELEEMLGPESLGSIVSDYGVGIKFAIAAVDRAKPLKEMPKWHSAKEPPKEYIDKEGTFINYLIYMPKYGIEVGNYVKPANQWFCMGIPVKATHWMPLPEPPKEG